jgi:hypothetical protein
MTRDINFNLSRKDFVGLDDMLCFYCNRHSEKMGFDRVDNSAGYETWNIVPACKECNLTKNHISLEQIELFYNGIMKWKRERGIC